MCVDLRRGISRGTCITTGMPLIRPYFRALQERFVRATRESGDHINDISIPRSVRTLNLNRYQFALGFSNRKAVLDIGCGHGYGSFLLSQHASSVIGLDRDEAAICAAKERFARANITFVCREAIDFLRRSGRRFDLITMFEVLEHLESQELLLELILKTLKSNGMLLLSTPNKRYTTIFRRNPYHVHEFDLKELVRLVESAGFCVHDAYGLLPGALMYIPLPYYTLMRLVQLIPSYSKFLQPNTSPATSRTLLLLLKSCNSTPR